MKAQRSLAVLATSSLIALFSSSAHADIPAGYMGKPFDPAMVGGAGIIPATVKAGPYAVPGRIDLVNYDMGGEGVAYHAEAHYTTKGGDGYRSDRPTATMCLTREVDFFYDTGTAQDGMKYPAALPEDFYIGSVHPNDWFNYTVDVKTAGMYTLSAHFSTGNGPPGGEGGDGDMELIFFVNGTQQADWKTKFPDYQDKADFHNWKAYPSFAMLTLTAGIQVIKIQAPFKHLNLDYLQLDLVGGPVAGEGGSGGTGGNTTGGSATGGSGTATAGASGSGAEAGSTVLAGSSSGGSTTTESGASSGGGGSSSAGTSALAGTTSSAGTTATPTSDDASGCSCSLGKRQERARFAGLAVVLGLVLAAGTRRRAR